MPYQALSLLEFASKYASVDSCVSALIDRRWPNDGSACLAEVYDTTDCTLAGLCNVRTVLVVSKLALLQAASSSR